MNWKEHRCQQREAMDVEEQRRQPVIAKVWPATRYAAGTCRHCGAWKDPRRQNQVDCLWAGCLMAGGQGRGT